MPWLEPALGQLSGALARDRFPHGVLLTGPEGVGKERLALELAALLLCHSAEKSGQPCGECRGCVLLRAGNHPDFYRVEPPEDKKTIGVDQIRSLAGELNLTASMGERRVAIICPADVMTHAAANSLLKTLEEPSSGTVLILVAARPSRLPATVRSRCQITHQPCPPLEQADAWLRARAPDVDWGPLLRLANGAPLKAVTLQAEGLDTLDRQLSQDLLAVKSGASDPLEVAERWKKTGGRRCLDWLHSNVLELARAKAVPAELPADLQKTGENIHLERLLIYADQLAQSRVLLESPANELLVLESALIPWTRKLNQTGQQAGAQ